MPTQKNIVHCAAYWSESGGRAFFRPVESSARIQGEYPVGGNIAPVRL